MALEFQNNPSPSLLMVEGDPEALPDANPAAGQRRLAVGTDHLLYLVDDSGVKTAVGGASGAVATDAIWDAKGDLAGGTGANTASKLTVGSNDTILMADSSQTTGLKWVASQTPSTQAFSDAAAEGTADTYARGDHKHAMPASPGGGGALVLIEQHAASNSASLDFTSTISSTYDEYMFECVDIIPATSATNLLMQVGTGGGPTYDTGSNYYYQTNSSGGGFLIASSVVNNAGYGHAAATVRLFSPQSATLNKVLLGQSAAHNGSQMIATTLAQLWATTTALTAVRFLMSSGNITSGTVRAYGIAK